MRVDGRWECQPRQPSILNGMPASWFLSMPGSTETSHCLFISCHSSHLLSRTKSMHSFPPPLAQSLVVPPPRQRPPAPSTPALPHHLALLPAAATSPRRRTRRRAGRRRCRSGGKSAPSRAYRAPAGRRTSPGTLFTAAGVKRRWRAVAGRLSASRGAHQPRALARRQEARPADHGVSGGV